MKATTHISQFLVVPMFLLSVGQGACSSQPCKHGHVPSVGEFLLSTDLPPIEIREIDSPAQPFLSDNSLPKSQLRNIRIAIDPGHIGGKDWDELTGKYITDSHGGRLSEGVLALEVGLLLEKDLKAEGAEVYLTRRAFKPVSQVPFEQYADRQSEFFLGPELDERAKKIISFKPDLTLILHFDETRPKGDPNVDHADRRCSSTKAFIAGNFKSEELFNPADQVYFTRIAAHPAAWRESFLLSRSIVNEIHAKLGIPLDDAGSDNTKKIVSGIYARNLKLTRYLAGNVVAYLELLCYEDPPEFRLLQQQTNPIVIDGQKYSYSPRLLQLEQAVLNGVNLYLRQRDIH